MSAGISVNPSTPLSTSSVIDAIVGNVLQTNLALKKEEDVKPTIPLPSSVCPNLGSKSPRTEPIKTESQKISVKTEVKQETEESELELSKANKNNSDSDDASSNHKKPGQPITSDTAQTSNMSPRKTRKKLKLRGPRNYNLKSRELVSDTDSESSEAESKRSLPPKRRKTIEKTAKKAEVVKKADESDIEKSLVCRETIERSPEREASDKFSVATPASKNTDSSDLDSITGSPKRNGSDLESVTTRTRGGVGSDVDSIHDSVTGSSRRAGSVDSRGGIDSSSDTRSGRQGKRKRPAGNGATSEDISPIDAKKKRKSRDSVGRGRGKGRGRVSGSARQPRDEEVGSEASNMTSTSMMGTRSKTDFEMTKLERLDNAELEALAQPKQNANSKYNFYVKLDSTMDSGSRISALQSSLEDLRKTYLNIKTELTALERRRKKIRKKKEQRNNTNEISTPS